LRGLLREREVAVAEVDVDDVPGAELAGEESARDLVEDRRLDQALQRARAVHRVVALRRERRLRTVGHLEADLALLEDLADARDLDLDDAAELLAREAVEDDDVVDAVQELGTKV